MAFNNFPTTDLQNLNLDWLLRRLVDLEKIVEELVEHGTGGNVQSVNGKTGVVVLNAHDVGAYVKPAGGIPKTDLAQAVRTSLGKADTAYQKPRGGITETDLADTVRYVLMPDYDQNDSNKFLRIDSDGYAIWDDYDTTIKTYINTTISGKLNIAQGVANAGKFMVVGSDGNIVPVTMTEWQGGSY